MATGGSSIYKGSDLIHDYSCSKCEENDLNTEAMHFCPQCEHYLCDKCLNLHTGYHNKHTVYGRGNIQMWAGFSWDICDVHGDTLNVHCDDHQELCCSVCVALNHSIRAGYKSAHDYYKDSSSAYFPNNIQEPMLFVNALDDPVCPPDLLKYPREYVEKTDNCIFITTKHSGHLGFFEGGVLVPERITWLDRVIIEYADGVASVYLKGEHPSQTITVKQVEELSEREIIIDNSEDDSREVTLRKREVNQDFTFERAVIDKEVEDKEKRDTLKRGEIIQQATSIVQ